ncbi:response regulator [Stenotrophomonas tumulicola]|uniref:Response regulator transcription factor n=1 Tax=Stenotrophomonas tumulicola TaxID=1685415 RepID=A0A7W3IGF3_9GAMM|nr:response regulator transcription factor [Stenotrophomonas tumulicola]MBA8680903.1 response regulator transcription factor [Stenotrophomonas tumulicola]
MTDSRILIIEDDLDIGTSLATFLVAKGFAVQLAGNVQDATRVLQQGGIDLILLDVMLPGEDGLSFCRRLDPQDRPRIIMLTALSESMDKVIGLELGADDYVTKPFEPRELLARIRAVLRRTPLADTAAPASVLSLQLKFAGFVFHPYRRLLRSPAGTRISLTGAESDLLLVLCQHPRQVLSRIELIALTRGDGFPIADRSVDLLISRLRRKLSGNSPLDELIHTVRADGYAFHASVSVG